MEKKQVSLEEVINSVSGPGEIDQEFKDTVQRMVAVFSAAYRELGDYGTYNFGYRLQNALEMLEKCKGDPFDQPEFKSVICEMIGSMFMEWSRVYRSVKLVAAYMPDEGEEGGEQANGDRTN